MGLLHGQRFKKEKTGSLSKFQRTVADKSKLAL